MKSGLRNIVIVGAGPGGLAAAMLLAAHGARVTVLERQARVGGRTGSWRIDGFSFDIGPTFFLYPRILEDIFRTCGRDLWQEIEFVKLDPMYRVAFEGGGKIDAQADQARMMAEIATLAPADARNLPRYMADNRRKLDAFRPVLERPFDSLVDYLRGNVMKSLFMLRPQLSLDRDLRRYFADPRVRQAFSFQAKYLGMSPFNCPSLFTILAFLEHEFGVYHPVGGHGVIMERMAAIAIEMGVDIRLSEPVDRIDFDGHRACAVETPVGRYAADAVVINADFAQAMKTLVPNRLRRRWSDSKIESKKFSCSTFMMYLGIEGLYEDVPHHSILLAKDLEKNIDEIQSGLHLPEHPSIYVQNAGVTDATLAPDGMSTIYILAPVSHMSDHIDWERETAGFREKVLDRLAMIGLGGLRERIRTEKILTPQGWQDDLSIYRGATFNLSHSLRQMLYFRPHNRFEDLQGVYLVGGGTHPGSGLPVIFESARISTGLIVRDLSLAGPRIAPDEEARAKLAMELEEAT